MNLRDRKAMFFLTLMVFFIILMPTCLFAASDYKITDLGYIGEFGDTFSTAYGINYAGTITYNSLDSSLIPHAYIWDWTNGSY